MSLNLGIGLFEAGRACADKLAWKDGERRLTYQEMSEGARRFAGGLLQMGLQPGDRVALMIPNCLEFPIAYYGILNAGCVVVPFNMLLKSDEVKFHLDDSQARALVGHANFLEHARRGLAESQVCDRLIVVGEPVRGEEGATNFADFVAAHSPVDFPCETSADDPAVFIYTSGTTGKPKAAVLSHANLFLNAQVLAKLTGYSPDDVLPAVLPLFHSFGQTVVMNTGILAGVTIVSFPRFDAEAVLKSAEEDRLTIFLGVPTMFQLLLAAAEQQAVRPKFRQAISGGASIPFEVINRFEKYFDTVVLEGYGLSETSPGATFNVPWKRKPRSVGLPLWGTQVEIHDSDDKPLSPNTPGEICIRGHNLMLGYHNQPEQTAEARRNGWFHTGDVGYLDDEGYLFIVDRIKDLIIRGGYNVYPREVEEVIYQLEGVREAAVVGVPDELLGEEIVACLSVQPEPHLTEEAVIEWCRAKLANYKCPRRVLFINELPKNSTGKILKRELRELIRPA